ncbi:MAG: hypothetical protein LBM69_06160 [Lachnospiraceae bacterium]|jgi:hypothetical protein|nr:hypothetical protein [Lachnospiraceae bacterium]
MTRTFHFNRIFSGEKYKGLPYYLNTQKKYEWIRTILFFGISAAIFLMGYMTTGTHRNLLTIVAVLGCLPASKSAVSAILYLRCHSPEPEAIERIISHASGFQQCFDMYFTSYDKNYSLGHLVVYEEAVYAYVCDKTFTQEAFTKHINSILSTEGYAKDQVRFFFFDKLDQYCARLDALSELQKKSKETTESTTAADIIRILKSVSL